MVLSQAGGPRSFPVLSRAARAQPNPARIFGVAGAIALNIALLMLLLAPMGGKLPLPAPDDNPIVVQIFDPVKPPPLPPPVDPVAKETKPTPPRQETIVPPVPTPVLFEDSTPMDLPPPPVADPAPSTTATPSPPDTAPIAGVRLQYASAPPPGYPRGQLADRVEGTVLLQVLVDVDGTPLEVTVHQSSGSRELDRAAQQQILKKWKFKPATKDGHPIQAIGIVPIDFKLG